MCYVPFIVKSLSLLDKQEYSYEIQSSIAEIIMTFCLSSEYSAKPIDISLLVKKFSHIN